VKRLALSVLCGWAWFALAWSPSPVAAQETKPLVVVSINKIETILSDVKALAAKLGQAENPQLAMAPMLLPGVDLTKPAGLLFSFAGGAPSGIAFVPVSNLDQALGNFQKFGMEVKDAQPGIKQVGPAFLKEQDGYLYAGMTADALTTLPDPAQALGDLPTKYDVAISVHLQELPLLLRQVAIGTLKQAIDEKLKQQDGESDSQFALRKEVASQQTRALEELFDQCDQVWFGLDIDGPGGKIVFDYGVTPLEGSPLATQLAEAGDVKTRFGSVLSPAALIQLAATLRTDGEGVLERTMLQLRSYRDALDKLIDESPDLDSDAERTLFKELAGQGLDVVEDIVQGGKVDLAANVIHDEGSTIYAQAALHVPDARKLEALVKQFLTVAMEAEETFPPVKFNAAEHNGATIHQLTVPPPPDAEKVADFKKTLGDSPVVLIGFTDDAAFVILGQDPLDRLKKLIDNAPEDNAVPTKPLQFVVNIGNFLRTALDLDPEQAGPAVKTLLDALEPGSDQIKLTAEAVDNAFRYRLEIGVGVLQTGDWARENLVPIGPGGLDGAPQNELQN